MTTENNGAFDLLEKTISNHSLDAAERFRRLFKRFAGRNPGIPEIVLLNRFWRQQLGVLTINTLNEREWLVDDVDGVTWVQFFQNNILNTVIREDLPKSL